MKAKHIIFYSGFILLVLVLFYYFAFASSDQPVFKNYSSPTANLIKEYFESWNNKDYEKMYSLISDGFKKIDPNAKNLNSFIKYANSQNIKGVKVISVEETYNNEKTSTVDYSVEFNLQDDSTLPFSGTYTLKYRKNDFVEGWKMIHPYGENIDNS